jgi:hypothetical protein
MSERANERHGAEGVVHQAPAVDGVLDRVVVHP